MVISALLISGGLLLAIIQEEKKQEQNRHGNNLRLSTVVISKTVPSAGVVFIILALFRVCALRLAFHVKA